MSEEFKSWDGEYPIFIKWGKAEQLEFVEDEEELVAFCASHRLNPRELQYYDAEPMYAWEGVRIDTEELENDDGELDKEVLELIEEFEQKLRKIKRPVIYWASYSPFKISEAQLESWCAKVKGTLA